MKYEKEIRGCFKNHRRTCHEIREAEIGRVETMRWWTPGTNIYAIDYTLMNDALYVSGDLGAAVYRWWRQVSLQWIGNCNLEYFHDKCEASGLGASYKNYEWNEAVARKEMLDHFKENRDCKGYAAFLAERIPLHDKGEFDAWLCYNDPSELVGDSDWSEWFPAIGNEIPRRTRAHLLGLRMAFESEEVAA